MADSPPQSAPWFEYLKGISKTGKSSASGAEGDRVLSPARAGISRRVNPVHDDVEAAAVKTTKSAPSSPDLSIASSPPSFSFSKGGLQLVPAPAYSDSAAKDNGTVVQPTKRTSSRTQHPAKPSAPPLSLLPPPAISSPRVHSKSFQYPVVKDFHVDPSIKYDLGPESESSRSRRCCYCILTIILVFLLVLGIAMGILVAKLNPKQPSISIVDLQVTSLNFTEPGGVSQLKMGMHFSLNVSNPNKYAKVIYSQISTTVSYNNTLALGNVDIGGFVQGKGTTNFLTPDGIKNHVTSVPADTAVGLGGEVASNNVQLDLRGSAGGRYKILWFKINRFSVPIYCHMNVKPADSDQQADIISNSCYASNAR